MQSTISAAAGRIVIVGTGGTIAGRAASAGEVVDYDAGVVEAADLVAAVPSLSGRPIEAVTVARGDSCDMTHDTWLRLHAELRSQLARPEVAGVVVTHGTDTLEETAYFLLRTLLAAAAKPVVLTAAMRPASALSADGPRNLFDAVELAASGPRLGARGVLVAFGGSAWSGAEARKVHGQRLAAFEGGEAGAMATWVDGAWRAHRPWPAAGVHPAAARPWPEASRWPVVEIVTSHAGARGATIDALVAAGADGIVIAGTGNGSVHADLRAAARRAEAAGVRVMRASRCVLGGVVGGSVAPDPSGKRLPTYGAPTPAQARIELLLDLLDRDGRAAAAAP